MGMKYIDKKYLLKEAQRTLDESDSTAAFCLCQRWILKDIIAMLKEQETTFEKDGHHIRCTSCGNYWCDIDSEGNLFPHNYCPVCGRKVVK